MSSSSRLVAQLEAATAAADVIGQLQALQELNMHMAMGTGGGGGMDGMGGGSIRGVGEVATAAARAFAGPTAGASPELVSSLERGGSRSGWCCCYWWWW